jgi:hypothetical protein
MGDGNTLSTVTGAWWWLTTVTAPFISFMTIVTRTRTCPCGTYCKRGDPEIKQESGTYVDCSIKFPPPSAGTARKCAAPTASPADDSSGDAQDLQHLGFKLMRTEKPEAGCADPREGLAKRMVFHYTLRTVDQDGDMIK